MLRSVLTRYSPSHGCPLVVVVWSNAVALVVLRAVASVVTTNNPVLLLHGLYLSQCQPLHRQHIIRWCLLA